MLVNGLALRNFRSFGDELQLIPNMRKVNLLAGANNSGKSNVLQFMVRYLNSGGTRSALSGFDIPQVRGASPDDMELAVAIPDDDGRILRIFEAIAAARRSTGAEDDVRILLQTKSFRLTGDNQIWFKFTFQNGNISSSKQQAIDATEECGRQLGAASSALTSTAGGSTGDDAMRIIWERIGTHHNYFSKLLTSLRRASTSA